MTPVLVSGVLLLAQAAGEGGGAVQQSGLALSFRLTPGGGGLSQAELVVRDARTRQPVTGLRPGLWFDRRRTDGMAEEISCADKAKLLASGTLGFRADVDLNRFLLVTLNADATVAFINPTVRFEATRLESVVALPGRPGDWARVGDRLVITIPERRQVVVLDLLTRKLTAAIGLTEAGEGRPMRVVASPLGRRAFVGLDGGARVAVIDAAAGTLERLLDAGRGLHGLAISNDSRHLAVTSTESGEVHVYDAATLALRGRVNAGAAPVAVVWSEAAQSFYVAPLNEAVAVAVNPERATLEARIPTVRGVAALAAEGGGRYLLAASQTASEVLLIDTAVNRVAARAPVNSPDQVVFNTVFAALRSVETNHWTLFDLSQLRQGRLQPAEAVVGRAAPAAQPAELGVAAMAAALPGGQTLAIASAADQMIYTMAGTKYLGAHRNYGHAPLGLLVLDQGLTEREPGVYTAAVRFPFGGRFDVPVVIAQPPARACFSAQVQGPPPAETAGGRSSARVVARPVTPLARVTPGAPVTVRFRLTARDSGEPLAGVRDARLRIVRLPDWQQQAWLREAAPGEYEAIVTLAEPGEYQAVAGADSVRLGFHESEPVKLRVEAAR